VRLAIVAGPPSSGKTSVLLAALEHLRERGLRMGAVKLDCLVAGDEAAYAKAGIEAVVGLSGYLCPDHYFGTNIDLIVSWGRDKGLDLLLVESAGLCNRCSPYIRGVQAVAVMDTLGGMQTPRKVGPLLRMADVVVLTRGDLVSQAEREVFRRRVAAINRLAKLVEVNGLTGQGALRLAKLLAEAPALAGTGPLHLRHPMPSAVCSFCLGERRLGSQLARGNVRMMTLPAGTGRSNDVDATLGGGQGPDIAEGEA